MKYIIDSVVVIDCNRKCKFSHVQEFSDDLNVFGRVYEYHKYMNRLFPNYDFKAVKIREII